MIEAKQSAEFINESFYIIEASLALGDYYYNISSQWKNALKEYFSAKRMAANSIETIDISAINKRIEDMKLRMEENDFLEIKNKYGKEN